MRILLVHNYYQEPGGEDVVFHNERELLRQYGHEVTEYTDHNERIHALGTLTTTAQMLWSLPARRRLSALLREQRYDVVHFHNAFLLISPAAYQPCREAGVAVVQTLHNYRLLCPAATLYRDGKVCELCVGKTIPWPGVRHACYRRSRSQTGAVAAMLALHHWLKTWHTHVDLYITLTEFCRQKFVQGGLPAEKIVVKPNFVSPDPGLRRDVGSYALFIGRLSAEKGISLLLSAWQQVSSLQLKIIGDGPLRHEVQAMSTDTTGKIEMLGHRPSAEVLHFLKGARFLVFPSEWYETFGRVAIEAFACGVPVIASRLGAIAEIVEEGRTGLLFQAGDPQDLANKVHWAILHPEAMHRMGENARQAYEQKYTSEANYCLLSNIYERAMTKATEIGKMRSR
jgi:glycosyltransferase involved in cell wall biosynthesis